MRRRTVRMDGEAGCHTCDGYAAFNIRWSGPTALAQAARHHDKTGHTTWAEQTMNLTYCGADRDALLKP